MRKKDYLYIHGLLAEVENHIEHTEGVDVDTSEYDSLDIAPSSLHKQKGDHREAVLTLASELGDEIEDLSAQSAEANGQPATAD